MSANENVNFEASDSTLKTDGENNVAQNTTASAAAAKNKTAQQANTATPAQPQYAAPQYTPPQYAAPQYAAPTANAGFPQQAPQYQQPGQGLTQPAPRYAPPAQGYAQPNQGYAQPNQGYAQPNQSYAQAGQNYAQAAPAASNAKSKIVAGILGILLGTFGVHNFYLGHIGKAVGQLLITLLSFGFLAFVSAIWGLIEGILILISKPGDTWHRDAAGLELQD